MTDKCRRGRKRARAALFVSLVVPLFLFVTSVSANAEETQKSGDVYGEIDKIVEDFADILPEGYEENADIGSAAESLGIKRILGSILGEIMDKKGDIISLLLTLFSKIVCSLKIALTSW